MSLKKDRSINIDLKKVIEDRGKLGELVLVSGDFNILHPGHIRLLRFAKECGDYLVVAVNADILINNPNYNSESHRADMVSSLGFVDYCFISKLEIHELTCAVHPDIVVKCKEFEGQNNPEEIALANFRGKLIFSSGYTFQKSLQTVDELIAFLKKDRPLSEFKQKSKFKFYDLLFLDVLSKYNAQGSILFKQMFRHNPPKRIFAFLEEKTTWWQDLSIMRSFPVGRFVYALIKRLFHL